MSNSSPSLPTDRLPRPHDVVDAWPLSQGLEVVVAPLRFIAFWVAVALPFLYLPLLAGGLNGEQAMVFVALLSTNVVALVAGHEHGR